MSPYVLVVAILLLTASGQVAFKQYHQCGRRRWLAAAVLQFVAVVPCSLVAVQRLGVAPVYVFMSLSYALVALAGWRLFGERIDRRQATGIATIVAGCVIFNL
jgi:drug/metabolite transporter (DMT)-like permease